MLTIPVILLSVAVLLALMINLVSKNSSKLTAFCMIVSMVWGFIVYGTGFVEATNGNVPLSILRTVMTVLRMFVGVNELSAIQGTTFVSGTGWMIAFWAMHLMAFYSATSAIMFTIGAAALRQLRLFLSRRGDLTIIYGINENSINLGKECRAAGGTSVIFVEENVDSSKIRELNDMGMSVLAGYSAVHSEPKAIRKLHVTGRKVTVYAINSKTDQNLFYALELKEALEKAGVSPENTCVTLPGAEEIITSMLQVSPEQYGFGYVNVFDSATLAARTMIKICPPWEYMHFTEDGHAKENFECVIVGFGSTGQAALKQLLINGQYAGSTFRATVFAPGFDSRAGYILADCPELLGKYDIQNAKADGRSREFYDFIGQHLSTLKVIAICTGKDEINRELSDNLMLYLKRRRAENICVVQVGHNGARYQETVGSPIILSPIYTKAMLSAEEADRSAMILNSIYDNSDRSDWEKWVACDAFSKMSSRASADFMPAYIRITGSTEEEVRSGNWSPNEEMLPVLGETEHLRWNAFHFSMGYRVMSNEELEKNFRTWTSCKEKGIPCTIRMTKNTEALTHACLVSWDELDDLSARENAVTGRNVDYKQYDINNVLALPRLYGALEKDGKT
ncbi:MAG: hypothetical protein IJH53_05775 [Oscillospiraceae bacterium]|nr:hypothetical protein [Oscillospiraceae bacterium]